MKKKNHTKSRFISGIKKFFGKIDNRILIPMAAIAVFAIGIGMGSLATHLRFDVFHSSKNTDVVSAGKSPEYGKNVPLPIVTEKNKSFAGQERKISANTEVGGKNIANVFGMGYEGQNMRDNLFLVIAVKSILLIVLIAILVALTIKILQNYKKVRKSKSTVHVVRQLSKTHRKAVKIKKTKRK